jgi:transcriptional regulator with XRE-family HTH domain
VSEVNIGEKVKELRESRNISLRRLSEITGLSKTTLSDLENGVKNPSFETVEKIARAFNLTTAKFLSETESTEELVEAAKNSGSDLLEGLSKSEELIKTLYRAKDAPKETMDQMAQFIQTVLRTNGLVDENGNVIEKKKE